MKRLVVSISLLMSIGSAWAEVTVMNNDELASAVVQVQLDEFQPVLPDYKANGQIGGVEIAQANPLVGGAAPIVSLYVNPADQPQLKPLTPQMLATLNQILNQAQNIQLK